MATETTTIQNEGAVAFVDQLADGSNFDVTVSKLNSQAGLYDIRAYIVGGSCDVKYLVDADGDFASPDTNTTVDSFDSAGISEGNRTPLIVDRTAVRITNTSGGEADFAVVMEKR